MRQGIITADQPKHLAGLPDECAARRFVLTFAFTTVLGLGGVAALNLLVDPFGAFGVTIVPAESRSGDTRTARAEMVRRHTGQTVLIGSSRTRVGYDAGHPAIPGRPACNVGLDGTHLSELEQLVAHAARNPQVRRVVLSLDLHLSSASWQPNSDFECSLLNPSRSRFEHVCDLLWNGRSLEASVRALRRAAQGTSPIHDAHGFAVGVAVRMARASQHQRTLAALEQFCGPRGMLSSLQPLQESESQLRRICALCRERGIDLIIVIDPVHVLLLEGMRLQGTWDDYRAWKSTIVAVAHEHDVPVWDFTGYSPRTTEPLLSTSSPQSVWFWEPSHMRRELGDEVLARIFSRDGNRVDWGALLTPTNLSEHWSRLEVERTNWLRAQRAEVAALSQLWEQNPAPERLTAPRFAGAPAASSAVR